MATHVDGVVGNAYREDRVEGCRNPVWLGVCATVGVEREDLVAVIATLLYDDKDRFVGAELSVANTEVAVALAATWADRGKPWGVPVLNAVGV